MKVIVCITLHHLDYFPLPCMAGGPLVAAAWCESDKERFIPMEAMNPSQSLQPGTLNKAKLER